MKTAIKLKCLLFALLLQKGNFSTNLHATGESQSLLIVVPATLVVATFSNGAGRNHSPKKALVWENTSEFERPQDSQYQMHITGDILDASHLNTHGKRDSFSEDSTPLAVEDMLCKMDALLDKEDPEYRPVELKLYKNRLTISGAIHILRYVAGSSFRVIDFSGNNIKCDDKEDIPDFVAACQEFIDQGGEEIRLNDNPIDQSDAFGKEFRQQYPDLCDSVFPAHV